MSLGAYDDDEHERRERKNSEVNVSFDDVREEYNGSVEFEGEGSTEALLEQYERITGE
jgi:hypothetical protein